MAQPRPLFLLFSVFYKQTSLQFLQHWTLDGYFLQLHCFLKRPKLNEKEIQRSCIWIPGLDSHRIIMHNYIVFWKRPKTNEKDAGDGPGKKQDYELSSNFSEINLFCFCRVCVCVLHKLQWTINQLQMQFTFLLLLQFVVAKFFRQFIVNFLTFIYLFREPKNMFQVFNDRDVEDDDASAFVFVLLLLLFSISLSFSLSLSLSLG